MDAKEVEQRIMEIKARMPKTYDAIGRKAAEIGRPAYAMVRRAIAGQPNLFYAIEGGRVVGTPFHADTLVPADVAQAMVTWGATFVVMWGNDGAH